MNIYVKTLVLILFLIELFSVMPPKKKEETPSDAHVYKGILHVHSTFSDGGSSPDEIAKAAGAAGADFVLLTDHNTTQSRAAFEKRYGNVDLFVEMEASTPGGHTISFSSLSDAKVLPDQGIVDISFKHFLGTETRKDFFVALAHPSNIKNPWNRLDRHADGYELVNFDSTWQRLLSDSVLGFFTTLGIYPLNNYLAALRFFDIYKKDLTTWDEMTSTGPGRFAYLAHDTHAKLKINNDWWWKWPGYEETFRLASNVIFLDSPPAEDFAARKAQVYSSLRQGKLAIAFHSIYPFQGNDWQLKCGEKFSRVGASVSLSSGPCLFEVRVPEEIPYPVILKLVRNGQVMHEVETRAALTSFPVEQSGVYRLEVWVRARSLFHLFLSKDVPYVLYNPIYLR
jgi:hypothetical protein